jgi:hypothetical protein
VSDDNLDLINAAILPGRSHWAHRLTACRPGGRRGARG